MFIYCTVCYFTGIFYAVIRLISMLLIDNKDSVFCIIYFFNLAFTTIFHDRNNLYNTNDQFDYGGFRALMEAQSQVATSTTLFAYKFTDPGVYAFYLSTDINKKMVRSC